MYLSFGSAGHSLVSDWSMGETNPQLTLSKSTNQKASLLKAIHVLLSLSIRYDYRLSSHRETDRERKRDYATQLCLSISEREIKRQKINRKRDAKCIVKEGYGVQKRRMAHDKSIINPIMLRFRPIAPKPAIGADGLGLSPSDSKNLCVSKGRAKRKYVRVRRNSGCGRKKTTAEEGGSDGGVPDKRAETLQLLPERSDLESSWRCDEEGSDPRAAQSNPPEVNLGPQVVPNDNKAASNDVVSNRKAVEVWVTVEYLTGTCMDGMMTGFGSTDAERIRNLEGDTCPAFVSDGANRVEWVNGAFRRMMVRMRGGDQEEEEEKDEGRAWYMIRLWMVINERLPYGYCSSFSCHVKVQYWWGKDKYSQMMPCDVCKMDGGGFAWRLDVGAALTLGR